MAGALADALDLVMPRACVGCAAAGTVWCASCRPRGRPFAVPGHEIPTFAAAPYEFAVRAALLRFKERGRRDLVAPLGRLLADAVAEVLHDTVVALGPVNAGVALGSGRVVLVPVPSTRRAAAARGGDHLVRLSRRAGWHAALPTLRALALCRPVADSAGLHAGERAANLHRAMRAREPTAGCAAIIVDDIVTTGATTREACRALVAAGWPVLGAALVAATPAPRRDPTDAHRLGRFGTLGENTAHPLAVPRSAV